MTSSIRAASPTVRAIGPWVISPPRGLEFGALETRPRDGLMPTTPQQLEGMRMEPPPSDPSAIGQRHAATAAAEPAARSAGRLAKVPGIARRREEPECSRGAIAEFRRVCLPEQHPARFAEPPRNGGVMDRHVIFADPEP